MIVAIVVCFVFVFVFVFACSLRYTIPLKTFQFYGGRSPPGAPAYGMKC